MIARLGAQPPPHDPATLARQILAQSRFRILVETPPPRTWWDAFRGWVADRWGQLIDAFSHHVHLGSRLSVAAGDVLIGAMAALVIVVAVRLLLSMARDASSPSGAHASALPLHASAYELQTTAEQAAQRGAYAVAVALLFRAALALLDARGLLRDDPARTVNECRSDVRRRAPRMSAPFDGLARIFTAAVYAEDRMTPAQWAQAREAYGAFAALQNDAA